MTGVARLTDEVNTVHVENSTLCTAPITIHTNTASTDVFVNSLQVHRLTDMNDPHGHCPAYYGTSLSEASPNVFVNGLGVGRINDHYDCGAMVITGSNNVFCN